ncbi:MAG: PIN domain-containing protein [Thermoplasmata archaeon]|nr:PIN domain-containing protein [Thermoplasmata archaeon]
MKALDTPILLAILHGDKNARDLVRRLRGVEVATTELNLLELARLIGNGSAQHRRSRRESLDRLRHGLTVLPFDSKAAERVARREQKESHSGVPVLLLGALGALEANGCDELITTDPRAIPGRWSFRITRLGLSNP